MNVWVTNSLFYRQLISHLICSSIATVRISEIFGRLCWQYNNRFRFLLPQFRMGLTLKFWSRACWPHSGRAIAACKSVIRLAEFGNREVYIHSPSDAAPNVRSRRSGQGPYDIGTFVQAPRNRSTRPEIHVTTEHITMAEFEWVPPFALLSTISLKYGDCQAVFPFTV